MKVTKKISAKTKPKAAVATKPASKTIKAKVIAPKTAKPATKPTKPAKASVSAPAITTETIAAHAYILWEKAGRPHGRDVDFWVQAENELKQKVR